MKNLIVIAFIWASLSNYAQEKKDNEEKIKMEQMTPTQKSQLQLKKMILELDLNETQQKELSPIISEMNTKRETQRTTMKAMKEKGEKPTAEQRFEMENQLLDNQIEMKKRISKILTPEQMEKWEKIQEKKSKNHNMKKKNPAEKE